MVNHTLSDTAQIPERVLIMDEGRFILDERREALLAKVKKVSGDAPLPASCPAFSDGPRNTAGKDISTRSRKIPEPPADAASKTSAWTKSSKAFIGGAYVQKRTR